MAWINGQWVEDTPAFGGGYVERDLGWVGGPDFTPGFGGMLGGFGGDVERDLGGPRPPYVPPTEQQPIYDRGGVQPSSPTPYQPTQWAGPNATYPNWDDPAGPFANDVAIMNMGQPTTGGGMLGDISQWNPIQQSVQTPQFQPLPDMRAMAEARARAQAARARAAALVPAPQVTPQVRPPMPPTLPPMGPPRILPTPPVMRPPMPPIPPTIGDFWPTPEPPQVRPPFPPLPPAWPPGGDVVPPTIPTLPPGPKTDHEFNVMQRERTKLRLAGERAKTKRHYAKLRAKGASKATIAKAKAKSKARSTKIKGQSLRQRTIVN